MPASKLFELQPDPYDVSQKRSIRLALFTDVTNAPELREKLRSAEIDAALIRAELVMEPFVLLAAANRAVHQAAHNRMATRSLSAELVYSLSPSRNISDSLVTFGIGEKTTTILAAVFDDKNGSQMKNVAKSIKGKQIPLEQLPSFANYKTILKVYQLSEPFVDGETISDHVVSRLVTKDFVS